MTTLPLFLELRDVPVLVVGEGVAAQRKLTALVEAGARVTWVGSAGAPPGALARLTRIHRLPGPFRADQLEPRFQLAIAAAPGPVNAAVAAWARSQGIWVNAVDDPDHCTALWPAIVDRAPVRIAIGTEATAPVLARRIRELLEQLLPERLGAVAALAGRLRKKVAQRLPEAARRAFWERLFRELPDNPEAFRTAADAALAHSGPSHVGHIDFVGAGPGDPDLLTLQAARVLQSADVIVHDRLVDARVLKRARRDATFIPVGKQPGGPCTSQAEINRILIAEARRGRGVCRLKGGDPMVFGRLGEELDAVRQAEIPFRVVPGITAALGAAAAGGLTLTHRNHAHALVLATAHGADDAAFEELADLAGTQRTLAVYMGVARLAQLRAALLARKLPPDLPIRIVENASREKERQLSTSLGELTRVARQYRLRSPAMLIIGEVAATPSAPSLTPRQAARPAPA